jgi:hypothetical protein
MLQKKSLVVAVLVILVVLVIVVRWDSGHDASENLRWFYDVQSGELFTHDGNVQPPILAPSGGEGVLAIVYGCGGCDDPSGRQIAYLEKSMPATTSGTSTDPNAGPDPSAIIAQADRQRVASPKSPDNWVAPTSPAGQQVMNMSGLCPGDTLQICLP